MTSSWKQYQKDAASFFARFGFETEIESVVEGARGKHEVDVLVTGMLHGINIKWVVECKDWKTNIPKEKVLALDAVVKDIGADRGFLLSEIGFQSGAIRYSKNTNITLSSIEDLALEAQDSLIDSEVSEILSRRELVKVRIWKIHKATEDYMSEHLTMLGEIAFIDLAIQDGIAGKFPTVYSVNFKEDRLFANDWQHLVTKVRELLTNAETYADEHESKHAT